MMWIVAALQAVEACTNTMHRNLRPEDHRGSASWSKVLTRRMPWLQDVCNTMPELQAPRLFGREAEEALAYEALTGQQRYVELRGGPGEGKTSLACLLAKRLCAQWEQQPKTERGSSTAHAHRIELRGEWRRGSIGRQLLPVEAYMQLPLVVCLSHLHA
jgi:hypothetical protein